jgi:uncharacterized protein YbjT (DUF2867 family)
MSEQVNQGPILVLGATGKTGKRVVQRLRDRGVSVREGSRSASPPFDWEDRSTWRGALEGASAAYISYFPDIAAPGGSAAVGDFAEQAVGLGVRRLVLLSGRGEEEAQAAEREVQRAGAEWTVVRASWFSQNFSEGYMLEPILSGEVALPVDGMREPFVDVDDIADVAAAALTEAGHANRVYEVTGPRLLTFAEAVGEISRASGREISYVPVSFDEYAAALAQHEVPGEVIAALSHIFNKVLDGRNAHLSQGVREALGREPRDFRDYARETAAGGVWDV